jgi:autotransporter-associated beta strand protein
MRLATLLLIAAVALSSGHAYGATAKKKLAALAKLHRGRGYVTAVSTPYTGSTSVTHAGAGTLTLNGTASVTGAVSNISINQGSITGTNGSISTLTLGGVSTYSGTTVINSGTLGGTGLLTITSNALRTLTINSGISTGTIIPGGSTVIPLTSNGTIVFAGGTLDVSTLVRSGDGTLTLNPANGAGVITVGSGTLQIQPVSGTNTPQP